MNNNLVHLRMSSGDEVICEVMEWPSDDNSEMIVRNAMTLSYSYDEEFAQIFGLKPWFTFLENYNEYVIIDTNKVMATAKPNKAFITEYVDAVAQMHQLGVKRKRDAQRETIEQEKRFLEALEMMQSKLGSKDSSSTNVISFPDKTIH